MSRREDEHRPTHIWCPRCTQVRKYRAEQVSFQSDKAGFVGMDLVCQKCGYIVSTVYVEDGLKKETAAHAHAE